VADAKSRAGLIAKAENVGRLIENSALAIILSGMILLAGVQIFLRIFMASGIPWANEALQLMVLWVAMLGAVVASRENRHISIDVLSRILPEGLKLWSAALVHAFTAAVSLTLAWHSWVFVAESREFQDQLLGNLPAWWFQSVLPIAFLLIGYRYCIWFLRQLRDLAGGAKRA
jgi:TRAP-type C4-dicarboxylate transport system permease small subunit